MRPLLPLALLSLPLALSACKKDEDSASPSVVDGITNDVDNEVKGADASWDKAVEDVQGAGDDISDALSNDDDGDGDTSDDEAASEE